LQTVRM